MILNIFLLTLFTIFGVIGSANTLFPYKETQSFFRKYRFESRRDIPIYRLPTNLIPQHYDVHIRPILDNGDPDQFTAPGKVTITVLCVEPTQSISLHSLVTTINETSMQVTDTLTGIVISKVEPGKFNSTEQTYTITLNETLQFNRTYNVYMEFVAFVSEELLGLYRSKYIDENGNDRYMATTQFEDTEARKAFPCFDEPALKATFTVHIGYNNRTGYHALGNMDIVNTRADADLPGWMWNDYAITVNMSTYLLAIVVSDFPYQEAPVGHYRNPVKSWGRKSIIEQNNAGLYGAINTAKGLLFFEQYFDQTYDLPKMDSVGVPDFPYGAMENWGLMTYREDRLFFFENETTELQRKSMTLTIAHELAHQWFGNIVTMNWWNDIWLNEGPTVYATNLAMNHTDPEFDSLNTEAVAQIQNAMEYDVGAFTKPLSSYKFRPSTIIYDKGGSIMRMMQACLGETTFQKGLRNYFRDRKYSNAVQDDLFRNLNSAAEEDGVLPAGLNVKEIMDTWTLQSGYPLIRVTKFGSNGIFISQERHKHIVHETSINETDHWWVPITYTTPLTPTLNDYRPKDWLSKTTLMKSHIVSNANLDTDWILLNPDARSYYRVLYDDGLSALIKDQLDREHSVFTSASRSQLLDDYFTAAYNDYISIDKALDLTTYLGKEDTIIVWNPVLKHLQKAYRLFKSSDFDLLVNYLGQRLNETLHLIGPKQSFGDKGVVVTLRAGLLEWACGMRLDICRNYALELYDEWMIHPEQNRMLPDIRNTMVCAGMALGGPEQLNFVTEQFQIAPPNSAERSLFLRAMSCHSDAEVLQSWLSVAFANESLFVKPEAYTFFQFVASNSRGTGTALSFLEREFSQIFSYVVNGGELVKNLFSIFATNIYSDESIQQMEEIINSNLEDLALVREELYSHIQTAKDNSQWMQLFGTDMIDFFKNHQ